MLYKIEDRTVTIPDTEIEKLMKTLSITKKEAIETWLFDNDLTDCEEVEEMTEKAKSIRRYEKSDTPRKKAVKERKIDTLKKAIFDYVVKMLTDSELELTDIVTKNEAEIHFNSGEDAYTIKLIKHRAKK